MPGPVVAAPAADVKYVPAGVSDGGAAYAGGLTRYDNNEPQSGSGESGRLRDGLSRLQRHARAAAVRGADGGPAALLDGHRAHCSVLFAHGDEGNVEWEVQSSCTAANGVVGSSSFGTAATVTTAVSSTAGGLVTTASVTVAANSVNGCPATGATSPSMMTYRIFRAASDTAAGNANLLGVTLVTGRSQ